MTPGTISALALACLVAACGSNPAAPPIDAAPPTNDLHLDLHAGIQVYDHPDPALGGDTVSGLIDVFREVDGHSERIPDATVTLNGVSLPRAATGGFTTLHAGLQIASGSRVALVASAGASGLAYSFDCPDVVMTAPLDGATVALGDPVVASWTGPVRNYEGSIDTAMIMLVGYDSTTGRFDYASIFASQRLDGTTQTATLATPATLDARHDGLGIVVIAPGMPAADPAQRAVEPYCDVNRRVILHVAP
jgi:hypothetical protein